MRPPRVWWFAGAMAKANLAQALQDKTEVDITVIGRRTGREHSTPVWFVREGGSVFLLPVGGRRSNWYRNLAKNPSVRLAADGATYPATATPITERAVIDHVLDDFRARYGASDVDSYYPGQDVAVEVKPR